MGNTNSATFSDGTPHPTKEQMREAEDACAECENRVCDMSPYQYPTLIESRIHRDYVLLESGKLHRWHILISSDMPASKWPRDIGTEDGLIKDVMDLTKKLAAESDSDPKLAHKIGVSLIPIGPESGCNAKEATDITVFPEFVRYRDVTRENLPHVLKYHSTVIAPRHQQLKRHEHDPEKNEPLQDFTTLDLTDEQKEQIAESEKKEKSSFKQSDQKAPSRLTSPLDRIEHGMGVDFPTPYDLGIQSMVLLCGHTLRDKRCGVTGALLQDAIQDVVSQKHPDRASEVDYQLVSHVGGHKVAGNLLIFSRTLGFVFYGRVFPKHLENIVDKTIMGNEILDPLVRAKHNDLW